MAEAIDGLSLAAGEVLLGAVEPGAGQGLAVRELPDGLEAGPLAELGDKVLFDPVAEDVPKTRDLHFLLVADQDRLVAPVPDLARPAAILRFPAAVLQFCPMSTTITVRLSEELAAWLEEVAERSGMSQGKLIRDQLEKARASGEGQSFLRLAGVVSGPEDSSRRKGFSRP